MSNTSLVDSDMKKRFCYVNRKAPYGTIYAHEMLEMVLVSAAFEQDVSVVFLDDGVYQLKRTQNTQDTGIKNFSATFRALDDYDVHQIYVEQESLQARGLTVADLVIDVEVLTTTEMADLLAKQDVVITA